MGDDYVQRVNEAEALDVQGADPADVIKQVQDALGAATQQRPDLGLAFESVDLALATTQTREGGVDFKFKVPFVEWEAGLGGKLGKQQTTVIEVSLEPTPAEDETFADIKGPLTQAIIATADVVKRAKAAAPGLGLKTAAVKLEFVYSRSGNASLLVASGAQTNVTTHTLALNLKRG